VIPSAIDLSVTNACRQCLGRWCWTLFHHVTAVCRVSDLRCLVFGEL